MEDLIHAKFHFPIRIGLGLAIVCLLAACASKVTDANLAKIEVGMSDQQVKDILGKPDTVSSGYALGMKKVMLTYRVKSSTISLILVNDQVISLPGKLTPTP